MGNLLKWGVVITSGVIALGAVINAKRHKSRARKLGERGMRAAEAGRQAED